MCACNCVCDREKVWISHSKVFCYLPSQCTGLLVVFLVDSPLSNISESNVEPAPPFKPPKPKDVQPPDQEPKKEVEELPPPITVPRPSSPPSPSTPPQPPAPPITPTQPPQGTVHRAPSPVTPPAPVPPAQLLPRPVPGNLDPHQAMQPLFPHEYPRGYPATGFPPLPYQVDDMYGETVNIVHPGYVSPTGYTTTPYWTRPPEIDTQESVYEVENEHGIRDEEFRSMNIVRELFNRIGKEVSKEELPSYIVGPMASVPGGPDRERSIGMWLTSMLVLWLAARHLFLCSIHFTKRRESSLDV